MTKAAIICGASLTIGLVAGAGIDRLLMNDSSAGVSRSVVSVGGTVPPTLFQGAYRPTPSIDAVQLRAIMKEELGAALGKRQESGAAVAAVAQAQAPADAKTQQEQREALQAVTAMVAGGQWGNEERMNFHQKIAMLDPEETEKAMQQLVQAIDSGSLKVSTKGPVL